MKLYCEGNLVAVEKGSFNDQATGDEVKFYKNHIELEDGSLVTLGSGKVDFSKNKGKSVVCHIDARVPQGEKLFKLAIREMTAVSQVDEPEDEIS